MFYRLGSFAYRRRVLVVVAWIGLLVAVGALAGGVGSAFTTKFGLPNGVESKRGLDILAERFPKQGGGQTGRIVVKSVTPVTDPSVQQPIQQFLDQVGAIQFKGTSLNVVSPYTKAAAQQVSKSGTMAYAEVDFPDSATQPDLQNLGKQIEALAPKIAGVQIEFGGQPFTHFKAPSSELLGLGFAVVILTLSFGSVLATGLPIGTALAGIGVGSSVLTLLSHVVTMPDFATTIGVMMGLGVGIDYALFIVSRFRENLHHGHSVEESVAIAVDTSGRAVAFAGVTVVISLLGMLTMGVQFVSGLGIGAAVVVTITMLASLTLLPALVAFAGPRVEVARWRGIIAAALVAVALIGLGLKISPFLVGFPLAAVVVLASFAYKPLRKQITTRPPKPRQQQWAYKWSRTVQHHPWASVAVGGAGLVALALPIFGLRLGFSDQGNDPRDTTTRKAYDLLAEGFGPGFNGPLILVAELPAGTQISQLGGVQQAVQATPGVAFASPARPNDTTSPTAAIWTVIPTTSPQNQATYDLVHHLRADVLPAATAGTNVRVVVTGSTATQVDFSSYLSGRLVIFFAAVLSLSFLLLLVVFRSLLVPLKAVVMNLLSIGAAYGVVVAIFQWGWLRSVVSIEGAPIEPFVPMMLFAIVFGLSMDYEVFLLSRIKEEYDRTGDSKESVADGLAATARIITVAAAIMVVVFGSFLLEPTRVIRLFGLGLALAVLLDATVVRMLLVPATMELLGDRNWWIPRWLDKILPRINVEGSAAEVEEELAAELAASGRRSDPQVPVG